MYKDFTLKDFIHNNVEYIWGNYLEIKWCPADFKIH